MTTPAIAAQNVPDEVYGIFTGSIDPTNLQKIAGNVATACKGIPMGLKRVHLAFQSSGGGIGEGIALYNLFRSLPFDLVLYNVGAVSSIAVIAFVGAKIRRVSTHAAFMIHRTQTTAQSVTTQTLKSFTDAAILADNRTEAILREHITMPNDKWAHFDHNDLWLSAQDAVKFGIAQEIAEFSPPSGTQLFAI
jgi:ATP-dependent Clp protease protease subunit